MSWNYDLDKLEQILLKIKALDDKRKEHPEKYPVMICGPYFFSGESRGIAVCETDNDVQIINLHMYFQPELDLSFVPIVDTETAFELVTQKD
jgi:hypothetical protein